MKNAQNVEKCEQDCLFDEHHEELGPLVAEDLRWLTTFAVCSKCGCKMPYCCTPVHGDGSSFVHPPKEKTTKDTEGGR